MILYIDETENDEYFIVAGLLADSEADVELAYRKFKNGIKGAKLTNKAKSKIYVEFKSTLIDRNYFSIKNKMLEGISSLNATIVYSAYRKRKPKLNQVQKEAVYITLFSNILASLDTQTLVIFDRFGKSDFEDNIMKAARFYENVTEILSRDSQIEHGLQFADNICSTIRLYLSDDDEHGYYDRIKHLMDEV